MDEIEQLLRSPAFWFTAVFVGLVVGILAAVAFELIKGAGTRYLARWKKYQEQSTYRLESLAHAINDDPSIAGDWQLLTIRAGINAVLFILIFVLPFVFYVLFDDAMPVELRRGLAIGFWLVLSVGISVPFFWTQRQYRKAQRISIVLLQNRLRDLQARQNQQIEEMKRQEAVLEYLEAEREKLSAEKQALLDTQVKR